MNPHPPSQNQTQISFKEPAAEDLLDEHLETYPRLLDRVQSVFIDVIILVILMVVSSNFLEKIDNAPDWVHAGLFVGIWLLYEPVLTSFACTPGQYIKGIRVRRDGESLKRIGLGRSILRYLVKTALGWISFLTMHSDSRKRALHDMAAGSVMIKK